MDYAKRFYAIKLLTRHGHILPWIGAAQFILAGIVLFALYQSPLWLLAGIVLALPAFAVLRLAVEVIDLISETLLPR